MFDWGYKIAEARLAKGWTQSDLAKRIGTTQQQIARYESGENDIKSSTIVKISRELGVTVSYLLGMDGDPRIMNAVRSGHKPAPILGLVHAGEATEAIEQSDRFHPVPDEILADHNDVVWLEVAGNSMNRLFSDGTLVLVDMSAEVRNGDVAAVFVNGDDVTVKRVYFEGDTIRLHPESYDPEYRDRVIDSTDPDAPDVRFFGKVISYTAPMGWRP